MLDVLRKRESKNMRISGLKCIETCGSTSTSGLSKTRQLGSTLVPHTDARTQNDEESTWIFLWCHGRDAEIPMRSYHPNPPGSSYHIVLATDYGCSTTLQTFHGSSKNSHGSNWWLFFWTKVPQKKCLICLT